MEKHILLFLFAALLACAMGGCEPRPIPTEESTIEGPSLGDTRTRLADGMVMVYVPPGEFEMGSTEGYHDEQPVHTVALDGFWMDRTEVTNAQYQRCVEAGACDPLERTSSSTRDTYHGDSAYDDYPVVYVPWDQAAAYCEWAGGRLPTEAEWEYAARGPEVWKYPWGNEFDGTRLNYCDASCPFAHRDRTFDDGHADTAPVGSFLNGASWCGALDMAGNVGEWVADWYGEYPPGRLVNPTGPSFGCRHLVRGGSWYSLQERTRCAKRVFEIHKQGHLRLFGFRCVSSVSP